MPKTGLPEDYPGDPTTQFVLQWNNWSTDRDRKAVYKRAWKAMDGSALGFITAVADEKGEAVPEHIQHYLRLHPPFSRVFLKAFKKVKKRDWRLGVVVNQFDFAFPPAVTLTESRKAKIVMLYVVGDPQA